MNKLIKSLAYGAIAGAFSLSAHAATIQVSGEITEDTVWTADNEYILTEIVYLVNNSVLTIEPGTVIKGEPRSSPVAYDPGALVITRGSQIIADGTADEPIIFTSIADTDPKNNPLPPYVEVEGVRDYNFGLWGGLIILGYAPNNVDLSASNAFLQPGENIIEGLPAPTAQNPDERGLYGGNEPNDNSGILRYVSIRHGGTNLAANNEINGLTMGSVGYGTVIENVEIYCNEDDAFEWFGGTVFSRNLAAVFHGDDAFDYDEGFSGLGQFWFAVALDGAEYGNRGAEHDGGTTPEAGKPYALPTIYNATFIGGGATADTGEHQAFKIRDNAGGKYFNSIFTEYPDYALSIEDDNNQETSSYDRLVAGELAFRNNIWWNFAHDGVSYNNNPTDLGNEEWSADLFEVVAFGAKASGTNNAITDPFFGAGSGGFGDIRAEAGAIYLKPFAGGQVITDLEPYTGLYFQEVGYKGAFDPETTATPWVSGWTAASVLGYFAE